MRNKVKVSRAAVAGYVAVVAAVAVVAVVFVVIVRLWRDLTVGGRAQAGLANAAPAVGPLLRGVARVPV